MTTHTVFAGETNQNLRDLFRTTTNNIHVTDVAFDPVRDPYADLRAGVERLQAGQSVFGLKFIHHNRPRS